MKELEIIMERIDVAIYPSQRLLQKRLSDYKEAEAVPPEKRARLLRDLRGEVQAREIMGDEAYFGTASLISKIITYEQAMDEISNRKMIEGTRDMRVTWAEFRRMIAAEIYAESREEE